MIQTGEPLTDMLVNVVLVLLIVILSVPALLLIGFLWLIAIATVADILMRVFG